MKATKRLGIWMDHTVARLMEYSTDNFKIKIIESNVTGLDVQDGLQHSESLLNNKKNQAISAYYKKLIDIIKNYEEIVLFGPTNAKEELFNLIREDHRNDNLKIQTKPANKMSYEEQHEFIQKYFTTLLNYESSFNK